LFSLSFIFFRIELNNRDKYIITTLTDEKAQKNAFEGGKHNFPFYRISISRRGVMLSPPKGIISLQKEGVL